MTFPGFNLLYKPGATAILLTDVQPLAHIYPELDIPNSRFASLTVALRP